MGGQARLTVGARWNSTSFSGHTTAKGREEEEVREALGRCRLVPAWALPQEKGGGGGGDLGVQHQKG